MYLSLDNSLSYVPSYECPGGFFGAALQAFRFHKNLEVSPDSFLNALIAQAGVLITKNPELFRADLVNHNDQQSITATDPNEMWKTFVENIHIVNEPFKKLLNLKFSTTTDDIVTTRYCLIAAIFSPYYKYVCTECGIRGVRVEGTVEDWLCLRDSLDGFGFLSKIFQSCDDAVSNPVLEWITSSKYIVDRCAEILHDNKDALSELAGWWKGFVTENGSSGGPFMGGHVIKMMLINKKGELRNMKRKDLTFDQMPNEQLTVTVDFIDGQRRYLVGNFFRMSEDDGDCITVPGVRRTQ